MNDANGALEPRPSMVQRWLRHPWRWWCTAVLLAVGCAALWAHAQAYLPFFADDSFISLRYTQRLLDGKGLTWTDGEPVEGYSNLLWVLLCAIPGLLGVELVAGARVLGLMCVVAAMAAVVVAARPTRVRDGLPALIGVGLLAATDAIAVWSIGGLEPPLGVALLCWGSVAALRALESPTRRWLLLAALSFGLACWTRPDSLLWGLGAAVGLVLADRKRGIRPAAAITLGVMAFVAAQLAFRLVYYHDYVPNTAYAKVALTERRLAEGLGYFSKSLLPLAATWLALTLTGLQGLRRSATRPAAILVLCIAVPWTGYIIGIGGDIFPAWRHWCYVVGLATLGVAVLLADELRTAEVAPRVRFGAALVLLAVVGSRFDPENWAQKERWEWDGKAVAEMLKRAFHREQPLLANDAAGSMPYYSEFPALDMLGLNDRYLAHHRPERMGENLIGHELGDENYYLRRDADIFCFGVPPCTHRAHWPAQERMVKRREFRDRYVSVRFAIQRPRGQLISELWLNKYGRIGIRRRPGEVHVPAYLFASPQDSSARLNPHGQLLLHLPRRAKARLSGIELEPGSWTLHSSGLIGSGQVDVQAKGRLLGTSAAEQLLRFTLADATTIDLRLVGGPDGLQLEALDLKCAP